MTQTSSAFLTEMNAAPRDAALRMIAPMAERSDWVAEAVVDQRPFADDMTLALALVEALLAAPAPRRTAMFRAHPELAGREAIEGSMTEASTGEQGRLGLLSLDPRSHARLSRLNATYRSRFGYPFIIALHRVPDLDTLFARFEARLHADPVEEHVTTLAEIASVIRARTIQVFASNSLPLETQNI
ncbi:2-oxo-4-hydroxy-4-carboxy-5-ureidoimidazoline decarboxylase [Celeribacter neptunius]|uniref:2-oxo-4-hydroxy-4-carboxy-5-ureidoimidazoline decarboxylase n=1 Tax=Celeribacter neptunius TaxID=588602 RepID=A0A1I3T9N3_9RHOB|nr:2-oxo-4-hydroxy-4-carboxy-5-ureidoimidazoline decarboxylase [Celeribacter neptunius]SFJ67273.1 2-oxo-4-hydroxy-4-carboxy-5-ureidoimidazoline decarboxylase [Celeribacter neptunius]